METFAVEADVPGGPKAASRARRLVRDELSGRVPAAVLSDVALLVTELVANGVRHGGAHDGAELHVASRAVRPRSTSRSTTPVTGRRPSACARPDLMGGGGLGLHIVERVASRWGVREGRRTAVWFELDCPPGELL